MKCLFFRVPFFLVCCLILFFSAAVNANTSDNVSTLIEHPEARLIEAINKIVAGEGTAARRILEALLRDQPKFRLANLIYADLLAASAGLLPVVGAKTDRAIELAQLLEEAKRRYAHRKQEHQQDMIPEALIKVSSSQKRVIVIDSVLSRAHVFENGIKGLRLIDDYYATVGKNGLAKTVEGDKRTPMGVYFITSRLNPRGLDDLYGDGALPLNYPNEWDQRLGRTGYGIWLHGVPGNTYNRPPYATQGCIALPNMDIDHLYNTPDIQNTPVIISQSTNWVSQDSIESYKNKLLDRIEQWHIRGLERNSNAEREFYSRQFLLDSSDNTLRKHHDLEVLSQRSVALSDISLFKYPGTTDLIVATFNHHHYNGEKDLETRIRQYWKLDPDNQWRITYEGLAEYKPVHFEGIPTDITPIMASE